MQCNLFLLIPFYCNIGITFKGDTGSVPCDDADERLIVTRGPN